MEQLEFAFEYSQKEEVCSTDLWKQFEENAKQISEMVRTFSPEQLELSFWTFLSGFFKSLSEQFLSQHAATKLQGFTQICITPSFSKKLQGFIINTLYECWYAKLYSKLWAALLLPSTQKDNTTTNCLLFVHAFIGDQTSGQVNAPVYIRAASSNKPWKSLTSRSSWF